jgi:predicted aspartyl protease
LNVKLNGRASRLEIDTGASGLLVTRSVAQHAGLKPFSQTEMSGIGDQGYKSGYTAYADSIHIGGLEFQNCEVQVMDSKDALEDVDGLIGMDVFSHFMVTLDYPMEKLLLGPLPPRPGEENVAPSLKTSEAEDDDSDAAEEPAKPASDSSAPAQNAAPHKPAAHGPYDRYTAPEMKDYTQVYRVGHNLILPAALNGKQIRLFIMDTGAFATSISPQAAREVTKVHSDYSLHVKGISGEVEKVYSANEITFRFAQLSQKVNDVVAFDTSRISKDEGMEISGLIGATTLEQLTIHIDYRDGLVKFDYNPNRGYRF